MIKLGSTEIANVMLGTTKVDAIFLGNTKVYPILDLPAVEGVYVYHVDKKFYTFPEFHGDALFLLWHNPLKVKYYLHTL